MDYKKLKDGYLVPCTVKVLSNVKIDGIPSENQFNFTSMRQLVDWTEHAQKCPWEYCIACIDECSSVLNSRSFSENFDALSINTLLTCRHSNLGLLLTSQRFNLIDKLLRSVTQNVYQCGKIWRFNRVDIYDAYELENVQDYKALKPLKRKCSFLTDRKFAHYDTNAIVGLINKSTKNGDMLSTSEIISKTDGTPSTVISENKLKRTYRKNRT